MQEEKFTGMQKFKSEKKKLRRWSGGWENGVAKKNRKGSKLCICITLFLLLMLYDMYKQLIFPIENNIKMNNSKAKADSYMPCVAMALSTKLRHQIHQQPDSSSYTHPLA
jgi:hypothetical protein